MKKPLFDNFYDFAQLAPTELPDLPGGAKRYEFTWKGLADDFRKRPKWWGRLLDNKNLVTVVMLGFNGFLYVDVIPKDAWEKQKQLEREEKRNQKEKRGAWLREKAELLHQWSGLDEQAAVLALKDIVLHGFEDRATCPDDVLQEVVNDVWSDPELNVHPVEFQSLKMADPYFPTHNIEDVHGRWWEDMKAQAAGLKNRGLTEQQIVEGLKDFSRNYIERRLAKSVVESNPVGRVNGA